MHLKNILGLTCDPVCGLVEVPCIKRNAFLAVHAVTASELALCGVESKIPIDEIVDTLKITGQNSPLFKMLEENVDVYFVPASIAFGELFNRIIVGTAFSLFIAGLVRRSKLPFNPQEF